MIRHIYDNAWVLDTPNTTYAFHALPTGQLEHLYYGRHIRIPEGEGALDALTESMPMLPVIHAYMTTITGAIPSRI